MTHGRPGRVPGTRPLCPVLVGRDSELALLHAVLDAATRGEGAAVIVRGEPGIGKTRLSREALAAARERSMHTLVGRCVEHGRAPYRPLTEALLAAGRAGAMPDVAGLRPFRHALGTLVPDWRVEASAGEESPVVIGEGVLRLARALGGPAGTLLVVEDLHWADADTLAVVEYLADNVAGQPVVLLATVRPDAAAAADLAARLEVRGSATVLEPARLGPQDVAAMVAACAGTAVPDDVVEVVRHRSEGLPLLVEELLTGPASGLARAVPRSFADAVARRVDALPAEAVLVVRSAAVLGRRFDWRLLPEVTGLAPDRVQDGLAAAVEVQLLLADDGEFRFPHALTRDAVLAALLPPARVALARRAARAVEPDGDDDGRVLLAADLWCAAGEPAVAARGLVAAGRRATARGALVTAERLLERARSLATDDPTRTEAAEVLTEVLALAAKVDDALAVGAEALALLGEDRAAADRRARLHLALARATAAASRWPAARDHLGRARALVTDERLVTTVDALAAHVAMGEFRLDEAGRLADRAAEAAVRLDLPEVACEALEVLGRRERLRDLERAESIFERAHGIATGHGLVLSSIRTLHELGTIDMLRDSSAGRLLRASELAYRAGVLSLAATVDLQLVGLHAFLGELDEAVAAGTRVVDVAGPLGLVAVHSAALTQLGFAHALAGRRDAMEECVDGALRLVDDPETRAMVWGHARATASLFSEERARAREELDHALTWARQAPGVTGMFTAIAALLRVIDGAGPEAIAEVRGYAAQAIPGSRAVLELAYAVLDARAGDAARAEERVSAAGSELRRIRMDAWRHLTLRLLAEPALDGGWGEPHRWLTEALDFFTRSGHDPVAAASRGLLRRAGRPVPRPGAARLPEELRASGVTGREREVLDLLGERLSNREIAGRLYLSPRTVEKHVERLLQKTGLGTRAELGRLARRYRDASRT